MITKTVPIGDLKNNPDNPRFIRDDKFDNLVKSLRDFPEMLEAREIVVNTDMVILGGNMRFKAAKEAGISEVAVKVVDWPLDKQREFVIKDNVSGGEWDWDKLANEWDTDELEDWGLELPAGGDGVQPDEEHGSLNDTFIVPPFSVLDTRQGYWQVRRRKWLDIGIQSELGRDTGLTGGAKFQEINKGTSVFDPVLCELAYKWFGIPRGSVLDPFAGGSVRGIVASRLGFKYTGLELRKEQVDANRIQAVELASEDAMPKWIAGDSNKTLAEAGATYDMVFSCPPYADLEVYSDDPADISNMSYADFLAVYTSIINRAVAALNDNRFAVWVVGEVRAKNGVYHNLVADTITAFNNAGMQYYNEAILINSAGTAPQRAARSMATRKLVKLHQNVLVFYKGNPKTIKDNYPKLAFDPAEMPVENLEENEDGLL